MRKPRTLTWWSERPRNSSVPSARQRARSPVRYSRAPGSAERVGDEPLGGQRRAAQVAAGDLAPPRYSSPGTPGGTGRSAASSTWRGGAASGRPIVRAAVQPGPHRRRWTRRWSRSARTGCHRAGAARSAAASVGGSASPPTSDPQRRARSASGDVQQRRHSDGVACMTVIVRPPTSAAQRSAGRVPASPSASTSVPPARQRPEQFEHGDVEAKAW